MRRFWALIVLVYGALYTMTAAESLQGGDSGELLVVVFRGGTAHPPGYPLYVMLGQVATWLPLFNAVLALALVSTLCALGALITMRRALVRWGLDPLVAACAVTVLGVTPPFWQAAGAPEVFALNAWLAALLLWAAGRGPGPRGGARAGLLGLFFGLGLANHQSLVLLAPVAAIGAWRALREGAGLWSRARTSAVFAAALLLGLTPYLTLLGEPGPDGWYWGGELSLVGLVGHALRLDYGTFQLTVAGTSPPLLENTLAYLAHLPRALGLLLPFAAWGVAAAVRSLRRPRTEVDDALDGAALLASVGLASVVLLELANVGSTGLGGHVLERFYVLPDLLLCALAAVGLGRLLEWAPRARDYLRGLTVGLVCALVLFHYDAVDWSEDFAVEDYIINALDSTEPNSVIVGTGELQLFGFLAAHELLAYRTDVDYIDLNLLRTRWYDARVRRQVPELGLAFDPRHTSSLAVVADLLDERPVYVADLRLVPELEGRAVPVGPLLRIVPPGEPLPPPSVVERINVELFGQLQFRGRPPVDPTTWPTTWGGLVFEYYARTWRAIAGAYEALGNGQAASRMEALARIYATEE